MMTSLTGQSRRPGRGGFTLIEMVLVLSLLVVAVSMIAPRMQGFIRGRSLDSEARRMIALMHAAQSRAVSEGMPVMFWIDQKDGTYGMALETPPTAAGDPKAEMLTAADNLQISVMNMKGTTLTTYNHLPAVRFTADGLVDDGSPQVLRIDSADGTTLWLVETREKDGYEVEDSLNQG